MILPQIRDSLLLEMQEDISISTVSSLCIYKEIDVDNKTKWKNNYSIISTSSTNTLIPSPSSPNSFIEIENILIHNTDEIFHNFVISWVSNGVNIPVFKLILAARESFRYANNTFHIYDENGIIRNNTSGVNFGGTTNLSYSSATRTVASDTGTDAVIPLFSSTYAGLVPASGGGTTKFLRADGSWQTISNHTFANEALLDTYTQTEVDLADAVSKKHTHSNISILNTITESFTTALKTAYDSCVTWISTNGANLISHLTNTSNPHSVTKAQVGLSNVDNTSDLDKPISTATQTALDDKADIVHTHVEVDITDLDKYTQSETNTLLSDKVDKVLGKQLSTEDYTSTEKTKLAGIAAGAEVNVNADWNAISGDAEILNKPTIPSIIGLATISYVDTQDNLKVDKVVGKSLIDDTEITRLSTVVNFDNSGNITALADKVDKIPGKGLSTNDYTNTDQTKVSTLSGVNTGDNATNSQYSGLEASKQDVLVSGTNIKTINSESLLGSGDIIIASSVNNNFIQNTAPIVDPGLPYTWWDTSGGNLTLWVENGI